MQIKSYRGHRLIFFELRSALCKILLRPISVRTSQIVENHSWQNLTVFPAGAEMRFWYTHSLQRARLNLPCREIKKTVSIIRPSIKFEILNKLKKIFEKFKNAFELI